MNKDLISRRRFLQGSGGMVGAAWLSANFPAIAAAAREADQAVTGEAPVSYVFYSADDARLVEAIASRLIPPTPVHAGAPGARIAVFIDRVLTGVFDTEASNFIDGLNKFRVEFARISATQFADSQAAAQDAFLLTRQDSAFFKLVNRLTHYGMFALPSYGGNYRKQGWALIGFEDRHAFQPPFGYYDTDYPGYEAVAARYGKGPVK